MKILHYPNNILRVKTRKVKNFQDPKLKNLVKKMLEAMREENGIGLAAPQVNQNLMICIVEVEGQLVVAINPEIKSHSRKKVSMEEGCLSFPGEFYNIERPAGIKMKAQDLEGKKFKINTDGLLARALQHEIDHLNGILIIDRVNRANKKDKA